MNLTVKEQFIDSTIVEPFTGKLINVKWINPETYIHLFKNGYEHLFEIIEAEIEKVIEPIEKIIEDNDAVSE
jgi:hypothetical protein